MAYPYVQGKGEKLEDRKEPGGGGIEGYLYTPVERYMHRQLLIRSVSSAAGGDVVPTLYTYSKQAGGSMQAETDPMLTKYSGPWGVWPSVPAQWGARKLRHRECCKGKGKNRLEIN